MTDGLVNDFEESRAGDLGRTSTTKSNEMVLRTFRVYKSDLEALERHFNAQEQNITAGVRKILRDYVRKNGLL